MTKPLGIKNYGHIPHMAGSRMGTGDHKCHDGQTRICTVKARDKHDTIIVQEKLDGSNVGVARVGDAIFPLVRSGYVATTSPYEQHHMFAAWVREREDVFRSMLEDGQRAVGEWLALAHGTRYKLAHDPFVLFDVMTGEKRMTANLVHTLAGVFSLTTPATIHVGGPLGIYEAMQALGEYGKHSAIDPIEGAVWRVERKGEVDFLAKFVRPDKIDGKFLPEISGEESVWNWRAWPVKTI
jgi:hypothetical protein